MSGELMAFLLKMRMEADAEIQRRRHAIWLQPVQERSRVVRPMTLEEAVRVSRTLNWASLGAGRAYSVGGGRR